ncbi:MAG: YwmB family TATA-box binding protein [Vulcanibacillus sp.]
MGNHNKIIILLLVSMIFLLGFTIEIDKNQDIEVLIDAFNKTGADLETYSLSFSSPIGQYQGENELLATGRRFSIILDVPISKNLIDLNNEKVYLSKGIWGEKTETELRILKHGAELYISFKLIGTDSLKELEKNYNYLDKNLQGLAFIIKINSCVQGNINVKLSNTDQLVLIGGILDEIGAKEVERLDTELVKSISAYTPNIETNIMTGKKMMNYQVATHSSFVMQKTKVTMGTPIIVVEY